MRPPFVGHRRYSITHRAVQRLRELMPPGAEEDDEAIRDRLDEALGTAEDGGEAIQTLDAMLGEPQTLIPVASFGETLYAIVKEETVVTVLPKGHGEEILQRGQAMQQRVAAGAVQMRPPERDRFEPQRRRWQKDPGSVVVEHVGVARPSPEPPRAPAPTRSEAPLDDAAEGLVFRLPEPAMDDPVTAALSEALAKGRRRAAIVALREALRTGDPNAPLSPLWNVMTQQGVPQTMTVGDLLEAVAAAR